MDPYVSMQSKLITSDTFVLWCFYLGKAIQTFSLNLFSHCFTIFFSLQLNINLFYMKFNPNHLSTFTCRAQQTIMLHILRVGKSDVWCLNNSIKSTDKTCKTSIKMCLCYTKKIANTKAILIQTKLTYCLNYIVL